MSFVMRLTWSHYLCICCCRLAREGMTFTTPIHSYLHPVGILMDRIQWSTDYHRNPDRNVIESDSDWNGRE